MNALTITKLLKQIPQCKNKFLGVFSQDRIPLNPTADTCFIANTDVAKDPGTHWIAFYITRIKRIYYFDPYGLPPLKLHKYFNAFLNKSKYKWKYNKKQLQHITTSTCGAHCIHFIQESCRTSNPKMTVCKMTQKPILNDLMVIQNLINLRKY